MKKDGFTLIEILAALTLFSLAMVGLYFSMNGVKQSMATSMKRNVETSYASMLIAEVNPYDINVETAYDITAKTDLCTHLSLSPCPAEIVGMVFTRIVHSCPDANMADGIGCDALGMPENYKYASDVRHVNVYFYRNASAANPYRMYRKTYDLPVLAYNLENAPAPAQPIYRDAMGQVWISLFENRAYDLTIGSVKAGVDNTTMGGWPDQVWENSPDTVEGSPDYGTSNLTKNLVWRNIHQTSLGALVYKFPASKDQSYKLSLGFHEFDPAVTAAGQRVMDVYVNSTLMTPGAPGDDDGPVDIYAETGGHNKALTKTYTVQAVSDPDCGGCGVYTVTLRLEPDATHTAANIGYISSVKFEKL